MYQGLGSSKPINWFSKVCGNEDFQLKTKESRIERIKIQYDFFPKYCKECMLQGHNKVECKVLHPDSNLEIVKESDK